MKKIVLLFIAVLSSTILFAQKNSGTLSFTSEVINYGTIEQHSDGVRFFTATNTGDTPVVIDKVVGSCGCTVASTPTKPIFPGKSEVIKVKYATNRLGKFSKTVTVFSNAKESKKVLRIKGTVLKTNEIVALTK